METAVALAPIQSSRTHTDDGDMELVRASKDGNIAAFDELVRRYDRKLLRIAHNIIHNLEDAEEVVQEAFLKAFQKLDQFQGTAKFSTWLVRITLNESFMKLRKQRGFMESLDTHSYDNGESAGVPFDLADWAPNPEALYSRTELSENSDYFFGATDACARRLRKSRLRRFQTRSQSRQETMRI